MSNAQEFEKQLKELMKKFGKPGFVIFAWQEEKQVKVTYTISKMKLRSALPAVFWALTDLVKKAK
jgi:hypothetical protein